MNHRILSLAASPARGGRCCTAAPHAAYLRAGRPAAAVPPRHSASRRPDPSARHEPGEGWVAVVITDPQNDFLTTTGVAGRRRPERH